MIEVEIKTMTEDNKKIQELNLEFQTIMEKILATGNASIIMKSVLLMMGQLIQTIMLINFKTSGYMTNVEQGEVIDNIVHTILKKVYSISVQQVSELHGEWFDKKK